MLNSARRTQCNIRDDIQQTVLASPVVVLLNGSQVNWPELKYESGQQGLRSGSGCRLECKLAIVPQERKGQDMKGSGGGGGGCGRGGQGGGGLNVRLLWMIHFYIRSD